jgi:acetyl-CoA C-acetyltransferase
LYANAYIAKYGTTEEDLALVAVKNHKYAAMNPLAHLQNKITVDDVLSSMVIASPLKLYDCSPITDGAASVIVASEEKAKELNVETPIWVAGIGYSSGTANLSKRPDFTGLEASVLASQRAFKKAAITPDQVDFAEVHDCFTIAEIMVIEALGFVELGKGGPATAEGLTALSGKFPINASGGLKSKGHPVGATGVAQIVELVKQIRGTAEKDRSVKNANIGLSQNMGGSGASSVVHIMEGE